MKPCDVILVEDDSSYLNDLQSILVDEFGLSVLSFRSLIEAEKSARVFDSQRPPVVVLDLMFPNVGIPRELREHGSRCPGLEFLDKYLKRNSVIILTGALTLSLKLKEDVLRIVSTSNGRLCLHTKLDNIDDVVSAIMEKVKRL